MGKKKKKGRNRTAYDFEEAKEETVALQSIYEADFCSLDVGTGFNMVIVPHPGDAVFNHCSISLELR